MPESKNDLAARQARAERLEAEIAELAPKPAAPPIRPTSPREFIHKRMADLETKERAKNKGKPQK